MALPQSLDWVFWTLCAAFTLAGATLLVWSLWRDHARGRRRCPKCWYEMTGVPGLTCPECGREAKSESRLFKTRRRWRLALLSLFVLALGAGQGVFPQVSRNGPLSLVPTLLLIPFAPTVEERLRFDPITYKEIENPVSAELERRIDSLSNWEWRLLLEHCRAIHTRRTWLADQPLVVRVRIPRWAGPFCRIEGRPLTDGLYPCRAGWLSPGCGNAMMADLQREGHQAIGRLPPGATKVEFDVRVTHTTLATRRIGTLRLPVTQVAAPDHVLIRVPAREVEDQLRKAAEAQLYDDRFPGLLRITFDRNPQRSPLDGRVSLAGEFELEHDGVIMGRSGPISTAGWSPWGGNSLEGAFIPLEAASQLKEGGSGWKVRLRPSLRLALQDWERDAIPDGDVVIPLDGILRPAPQDPAGSGSD